MYHSLIERWWWWWCELFDRDKWRISMRVQARERERERERERWYFEWGEQERTVESNGTDNYWHSLHKIEMLEHTHQQLNQLRLATAICRTSSKMFHRRRRRVRTMLLTTLSFIAIHHTSVMCACNATWTRSIGWIMSCSLILYVDRLGANERYERELGY